MLVSRRLLPSLTARASSPQLAAGWRRRAVRSCPIKPQLHPTRLGVRDVQRASFSYTPLTARESSSFSPTNVTSQSSIEQEQASKMEEELLIPKKLPDETHEVIVVLETIHVPVPELDTSPKTHEVLQYKYTGPKDVAARIKNASIMFVTTCLLDGDIMGEAPYLKCIISHPTGTDHIDLEECRRRNVQVMNCPSVNIESVSEHALALYFATRRSLITMHNTLMDFEPGRPNDWKTKGSLNARLRDPNGRAPKTCEQEIAGIIGYGALGKRIRKLCAALGMKVLIAGRKDGDAKASSAVVASPGDEVQRTPFAKVLATATVLFVAVPLMPSTTDLISSAELATMRPESVIINVSRGGIVNEPAIVAALAKRQIFGYGTDVYVREPAGSEEDSVLLSAEARGLNLTLTSHLAWFADTTLLNIQRKCQLNVKGFVEGQGGGDIVVKRV